MGYTPPTLYVNKLAGGWSLTAPSTTTTDDLTIYPNSTDSYANIKINGTEGITCSVQATKNFAIYDSAVAVILTINHTTPDILLQTLTDKNLFLKTQGTGLVKFGAYTAGAATDSTGYITILDAAGNTRKLMVQA